MKTNKAQSTIEFTFSVIVTMFLIYGMIMVFRWAGMDLANRRVAQDKAITRNINSDQDASIQLRSRDIPVLPISAVYRGNITDGRESDG
jgi:hypothetical protein